ncbi:MAG TPA: LON peptidase substrate-binding domain-containing protein [Polyangiaceae bacterium]|jgi:Lon protease-like protein
MRRDLPPRASLDHLKKQAKDLLDAHQRAEPEALARIREAVPAFAGMTEDAIAKAPFALHDAQSAIAREYGQKSWVELRDAVAAQAARGADVATGPEGPSDALLRALMPLPFPPEVGALLRDASGKRAVATAIAESPFPDTLPCLPVRDALFVPRALGPIHVGRPSSRAAIDFALSRTPPTLAVFAQRSPADEAPTTETLHPIGCEAYLHARVPDADGRAWIVLEGIRWLALVVLETGPGGQLVARVKPCPVDPGDPAEVAPLAAALRAHVRGIAAHFPDGERLVAIVDTAEPERLADLVIANLPVPVNDKARYAEEPRLVERLRLASRLAGLGETR